MPDDVPAGLQALYPRYLGGFLQSLLTLDPAALANGHAGPILVINGTADVQVSAERDAGVFAHALAGRMDGSEVVTPADVSHNMKHAAAGDAGIDGEIDDAVRRTLARWLAANL